MVKLGNQRIKNGKVGLPRCTYPLLGTNNPHIPLTKNDTFESDDVEPFCRLVGYGLVPFDQKGTKKIAPQKSGWCETTLTLLRHFLLAIW